ncbi:MAG: urate hydroxylase PuuD [Burkholderiales bacterium]|nr:urate hydroxylase PuuD [Burkholderiales bacterium]
MESYIGDWLNLLLRWLHVITGIAWIGSSFYFVWLDNSLVKPTAQDLKDKGVDGELWAVHGGGFYNPQKYMVAPKQLPEHLHWFYWESYWTWMSGFALFVVLYLFNAQTFLIDKNVFAWGSSAAAIVASLVYLIMGWVVYDGICRVFGQRKNGDLIVGALVFVYVIVATYIACHLFAGRAAFLLTGAMLATAMSANVLMVIIPGQKKTVAAMKSGQKPDPAHPMRAKQRSVHNTYFTLPVLFAMLSNHYSMTYSAPNNWLVLTLIMLAGALIRQFFVLKHKGKRDYKYFILGSAVLAGVAVWIAPPPSKAVAVPKFAEVQTIVAQRCQMCHNAAVVSKNIQLHTPELIAKNAQAMMQQTVVARLMPLNNATQMTEEERAKLAAWVGAGAPLD